MPDPAAKTITDFVCTGCGLMCDDLELTLRDGKSPGLNSISPPCGAAQAWLGDAFSAPLPCPATIAGQPAALEDAIDEIAEMLLAARAPLITGLARATVESQRLAVEIADLVRGVIDATDQHGRSRSHRAVQTVGLPTATLGEAFQRCDLALLWRCEPAQTHPRLLPRLKKQPPTATIDAHGGVAALATLRALIRNEQEQLDAARVKQTTGVSLSDWKTLAAQLKLARYACIFASQETVAPREAEALAELARDLHAFTRAAVYFLAGPGNPVGAEHVLAWQTGYAPPVNFARGYPESQPTQATTARLLERGEVDAVLAIAADPLQHLTPPAQTFLRSIPLAAIDDRVTPTMQAAAAAIGTSRFAVASTGDVFRTDGIALPLRAAIESPLPPAEEILQQLRDKLVRQPFQADRRTG